MVDKKEIIPQAGKKTSAKDLLHGLEALCFYPAWVAQRFHKRDQRLWTFGAWSGSRYDDNSRALYEYVLGNCHDVQAVWMTRDTHIYEKLKAEGKPVALCNTKEGNAIQKRSGVFFATANRFDGDTRYMNGIHYVNLWHGVPIKKIGEDAIGRLRSKSIFKRFKTWFRKTFLPWEFLQDIVLCGSPFYKPFLQSAFLLRDDQIWISPEPRLDWMTRTEQTAYMAELDRKFNRPIKVLYMPTFRDNKLMAFNPFDQAGLNITQFAEVLKKNNIVLIYKGHYFDSNCKGIMGCERIVTVSDADYDNLYSFVKDADILLTDYSSVYFDFLYLRKPMILFPFDYDEYMIHSREFYFDYELMKGYRVRTWSELAECLDKKLYDAPSEEEVSLFRPMPIGECSKQVAQMVKDAYCG